MFNVILTDTIFLNWLVLIMAQLCSLWGEDWNYT